MPGITNPAEEYFKDGIWGWDPAGGVWLKLIIDPLTNRLVIDHPGDIEVVQPVPADLCVANYGWDGSVWRKLPLVWGYSDVWRASKHAENVDAGNGTVNYDVIGPGGIVVVTNFLIRPSQAAVSQIELTATIDAGAVILTSRTAIVAKQSIDLQCHVVLKPGDALQYNYYGAAANDDFYSYACGYQMKIAE